MEELLPIGSIVQLKNKSALMIIGYYPSKPRDEEYYDYICCNSIEGITKVRKDLKLNEDYYYIKKEEIVTVKYIGYINGEFYLYRDILEELKSRIDEAKKQGKELDEKEIKDIYSKVIANIKERMKKDAKK